MEKSPYELLAERLDALPNGYPPAPDSSHLAILEHLYTSEQAALAAQLSPELETSAQIAERVGGEPREIHKQLKQMVRSGLIGAGQTEDGLSFKLVPFVVGIYEYQGSTIDAKLAALFEQYYHHGFGQILSVQPPVHRVIPVGESIKTGLEVRPYESAAGLVASMKAWGVLDCICRKQTRLIGKGCEHPLDVCMTLSLQPGAFDHSSDVRALTQEEALATLHRAAEAGLVHSVSNNKKDIWYICNCCTCSCGVLRGMAEMGIANVVAKSAYVNQVDETLCILCADCLDHCQFDALTLDVTVKVNERRCTGCGVCTLFCTQEALHLVLRPESEISAPPENEAEWRRKRMEERGLMKGITAKGAACDTSI
jgi:Pyruvate/2-oxoacid:ferredoxin oxidoreductase delta subunit